MPLWITLTGQDIERADRVGCLRETDARRLGRRHVNNRNVSPERSLRDHIVAARAELAAANFYRLRWSGYVQGDLRGVADIGGFIDVKCVEDPGHCLVVPAPSSGPAKLCPEWAYLLVWAQEHPRYAIVGWRWGFEIAHYPIDQLRSRPGRPARFLPRDELYPPMELCPMIERLAA